MSGNISFGENSFTNTAAKEAKKIQESKVKAAENKKGPSALSILERLKKDQEKILEGMNELYAAYPSNPVSVAINSAELLIGKLDVAIDDEKRFGK